ncbi:MAG: hypothetical protein H7A15_01985 [Sinobacteraceae bacterium]|nr:hypothetical protein [Nevskiaceae bacterium]
MLRSTAVGCPYFDELASLSAGRPAVLGVDHGPRYSPRCALFGCGVRTLDSSPMDHRLI